MPGGWARPGETYTVTLNAGGSNPNRYLVYDLKNVIISSLTDANGNGTYQGWVTLANSVRASVGAVSQLGLLVTAGSTTTSYSQEVAAASDGVVSDISTGQPLATASVTALTAQAAGDGSTVYSSWPTTQSGQPNPQTTGADGKFGFSTDGGVYRLGVVRNGYQPYRSHAFDVEDGVLAIDIPLTPAVAEAATHTVYVTANGFEPAVLTIQPGSVVEWVNIDLDEHGVVRGGSWDSGVLRTGERYTIKLENAGAFEYKDGEHAVNTGTIVVSAKSLANRLFLPVVQR